MQKWIQPHACLDHGFHVLKPRSFSPNHAPKMQGRHQLFFGLRLVNKEFQHPAIQTKIEQHFGGFFHSDKSAPANRKTGLYANRDQNKQEAGFIFAWSSWELWNLFKYSRVKLKIKNLKRLMSFSRTIQWYHSHVNPIWPEGTFQPTIRTLICMYKV